MSRRSDEELAADIAEAISRIERYTSGLGYAEFLADTKTQDSVVRNVEVIGEAAKRLSIEFKKGRKDIDWRAIAGMRDRLIHDYFGINWKIVWHVVNVELPNLKAALKPSPKSGGK